MRQEHEPEPDAEREWREIAPVSERALERREDVDLHAAQPGPLMARRPGTPCERIVRLTEQSDCLSRASPIAGTRGRADRRAPSRAAERWLGRCARRRCRAAA